MVLRPPSVRARRNRALPLDESRTGFWHAVQFSRCAAQGPPKMRKPPVKTGGVPATQPRFRPAGGRSPPALRFSGKGSLPKRHALSPPDLRGVVAGQIVHVRRKGVNGPLADRKPEVKEASAPHRATGTPDSPRNHTDAAKICQSSGTPLRGWVPRSSKPIPDPATRSLTVLVTRTSPGPASPAARAPM